MSRVLVDTSIWVDHFRRRNKNLSDLLEADSVLMHPMILGELACGTPPARAQTLADLDMFQLSQQSSVQEVMNFVDREKLFGLGCGLVDMMLLASTLMTPGTELWTLDKRLLALAERFDVMYRPKLH